MNSNDTTKLAQLEEEWRAANVAMWAREGEKRTYVTDEQAKRSSPLYRQAEAEDDKIAEEAKTFNPAIAKAKQNVERVMGEVEKLRNKIANEKTPWHPVGTRVRLYKIHRRASPPIATGDVGIVEVFGPESEWPANIRHGKPTLGSLGVRLLLSNGKPSKQFMRVTEYNRAEWREEGSK